MKYRANIDIMPLETLLDPQGKAVSASMKNIGMSEIKNVRIGKHITLEIESENKKEADISKYIFIDKLKIYIRDLNKEDIAKRNLPKDTSGVVVKKIEEDSPLMFVEIEDVIVEIQKKKVLNSNQFVNLIEEIINKGEKTLYLAIYNSSNQRSYITVKLK